MSVVPAAPALAALAVNGAGGTLAGAWGVGDAGFWIALAAVLALNQAVLLPGYVWAPGPRAAGTVAVRALIMLGLGLPFTWLVATASGFLFWVLVALLGTAWLASEATLLGLLGAVAGVAAGGAAVAAQAVDERPGLVRLQWQGHFAGGVAGAWLGLATGHALQHMTAWLAGACALAAAGLPYALLALRGRHAWPTAPAMWRRAGWCCAGFGAVAALARPVLA